MGKRRREQQEPDEQRADEPDPRPMAYMTSRDPSPYLFESAVTMLGRASMGARKAVRSRRGGRRVFAVVGFGLMILVLLALIFGVLVPILTRL